MKILWSVPIAAAGLAGILLVLHRRAESKPDRAAKPARTRIVDEAATTPLPPALGGARSPEKISHLPAGSAPPLYERTATVPVLLSALRVFANDAAMAARIRQELASWLADPDPEIRKRAEILLAEIDLGWERAAFSHPNPEVRRALLESPPIRDAKTVDLLVAAATRDASPEIRAAALRGLPANLDAAGAARIVGCLSDPDAAVVRGAIVAVRGASAVDSETLDVLKSLALGSDVRSEVRRDARRALLKFSASLAEDDRTALTRAISGRTDRTD